MNLLYYFILFAWIFFIWLQKKDSKPTFKTAFALFITAASLTVLGLRDLAEPIMRISFIGWLIGILQALIEYRKEVHA